MQLLWAAWSYLDKSMANSKLTPTEFVARLVEDFPNITFVSGQNFMWSPEANTVTYTQVDNHDTFYYSLLHEVGHALEAHTDYNSDLDLIKLERSAWSKAKAMSAVYGIEINENHIENCLDSYRDWLLARAKCPDCAVLGLQNQGSLDYSCVNCLATWKVPKTVECIVRRHKTSN